MQSIGPERFPKANNGGDIQQTPVPFNLLRSEDLFILVVEGEPGILPKLEGIYPVKTAQGEAEALRKLREPFPMAILVAFDLESGSGLSLCRKLKENIAISHIPVILVVPELTDALEIEGINAGANAMAPQSISGELLALRICRLTEKSGKSFHRPGFLEVVDQILFDHIEKGPFHVSDLARILRIDGKTLCRKMKRASGLTPRIYLRNIRVCRAAHLLKRGTLSISDVAFQVGLTDVSYFSKSFKAYFGKSPSEFVKKHVPPK